MSSTTTASNEFHFAKLDDIIFGYDRGMTSNEVQAGQNKFSLMKADHLIGEKQLATNAIPSNIANPSQELGRTSTPSKGVTVRRSGFGTANLS